MIVTTMSWFLSAQTQEVTSRPSGLFYLLLVIFVVIVIVIVRQVRKSLTPKDKRGIESFGRPAKGERHD